jgi:hypothetical protein
MDSLNEEFSKLVLLAKYKYNDQVNKGDVGRMCSTHGGEKECFQDTGGNARRKKTTRRTNKWMSG